MKFWVRKMLPAPQLYISAALLLMVASEMVLFMFLHVAELSRICSGFE
jgi:hypothetical protein